MIEPNACRWCDLPEWGHYQRWAPSVGWHTHVQPTDQQRLQRMRDRRVGSGKTMPKKGERLPYKVAFTYAADVSPSGVEVKGVRPFSDADQAEREAITLAKRGAWVKLSKDVGNGITRHIAEFEPWTDAQRRLAELADEVVDLRDYDETDQARRMFEIRAELDALAVSIGVKRF